MRSQLSEEGSEKRMPARVDQQKLQISLGRSLREVWRNVWWVYSLRSVPPSCLILPLWFVVRTLRNSVLGTVILVPCGPFRSVAVAQGCSMIGQVQAREVMPGEEGGRAFSGPPSRSWSPVFRSAPCSFLLCISGGWQSPELHKRRPVPLVPSQDMGQISEGFCVQRPQVIPCCHKWGGGMRHWPLPLEAQHKTWNEMNQNVVYSLS